MTANMMQACAKRPIASALAAFRQLSRCSGRPTGYIPRGVPVVAVEDECRIQLMGRRSYSSHKRESLPLAAAVARLHSRAVLVLSGPDAARYLQGAITANVQPLRPEHQSDQDSASKPLHLQSPFFSAFLNPQGRVLNDVFIYPFTSSRIANDEQGFVRAEAGSVDEERGPDLSFLIDVDAAEAENLRKWIGKYRLRSRFDVAKLPSWGVWQRWGDLGSREPHEGFPFHSEVITCIDKRSEGMGLRAVAPPSASAVDREFVTPSSETAYTVRRYLRGIPEGQKEILPGQALPLESNLDIMSAIDFRKGCYVGQELTIRTKHIGVVRKRILPLVLGSQAQSLGEGGGSETPYYDEESGVQLPAAGSDMRRVGARGRQASGGKFLAGIGNIGLGLCRLDVLRGNQSSTDAADNPGGSPLIIEPDTQVRAWRPESWPSLGGQLG